MSFGEIKYNFRGLDKEKFKLISNIYKFPLEIVNIICEFVRYSYEGIKEFDIIVNGWIKNILLLPDEKVLTYSLSHSNAPNEIKIWDLKTGKCCRSIIYNGPVIKIFATKNNNIVISVCNGILLLNSNLEKITIKDFDYPEFMIEITNKDFDYPEFMIEITNDIIILRTSLFSNNIIDVILVNLKYKTFVPILKIKVLTDSRILTNKMISLTPMLLNYSKHDFLILHTTGNIDIVDINDLTPKYFFKRNLQHKEYVTHGLLLPNNKLLYGGYIQEKSEFETLFLVLLNLNTRSVEKYNDNLGEFNPIDTIELISKNKIILAFMNGTFWIFDLNDFEIKYSRTFRAHKINFKVLPDTNLLFIDQDKRTSHILDTQTYTILRDINYYHGRNLSHGTKLENEKFLIKTNSNILTLYR